MKIVFFIDAWYPVYGGATRGLEQIAQGLATRGLQVTIITRKLRAPAGSIPPLYSLPKFKVIRLGPTSAFENTFSRLWWILYATFIGLSKGPFDIVHGKANLGGIPAKLVSLLTCRPIIFSVHGSGILVWDKMGKGLNRRIMKQVEYFVQCKIRYDIETSVDQAFFKIPGNVNNRREVVPNGVDANIFIPGRSGQKVRGRLLFVGRLHPQKSLPTLFRALTHLNQQAYTLHVVGSGGEEQKLRTIVHELGLTRTVFFQGSLHGEALTKEYQAAQIFVLPSVFEGQPHTVLEAWAAGLPIVATRVGANPDMFTEPYLGTLVPIEDEVKLAGALRDMLARADLVEIGLAARDHVKKKYSWDRIIEKHMEMYNALLKLRE